MEELAGPVQIRRTIPVHKGTISWGTRIPNPDFLYFLFLKQRDRRSDFRSRLALRATSTRRRFTYSGCMTSTQGTTGLAFRRGCVFTAGCHGGKARAIAGRSIHRTN